jgi:hypothetical protein
VLFDFFISFTSKCKLSCDSACADHPDQKQAFESCFHNILFFGSESIRQALCLEVLRKVKGYVLSGLQLELVRAKHSHSFQNEKQGFKMTDFLTSFERNSIL